MIPVYFPFTHIAAPVAEVFCRCFGGVALYRPLDQELPQPLASLAGRLPIDIRIPARGDEDQLANLYHEYRKWCDLHGGVTNILKKQFKAVDDAETFVTRIRSEILGRQPPKTAASDPFLSARLFLLAAQDYDMAQETVSQVLAASETEMSKMFAAIKGVDPEPEMTESRFSGAEDPGALMTEVRLLSWYRLAHLSDDGDMPFLITTSPAVCEALLNHVPTGFHVCSINGIPCPENDGQRVLWAAYLADTAALKPREGQDLFPAEILVDSEGQFVFSLYLFPDVTLEQLLCITRPGIDMPHVIQPGIGSILVGLMRAKK